MVNYRNKECAMCGITYKPTSPKQKYCVSCKDEAARLKQRERDKKRTILKRKSKKEFIRECPICGKVFSTYYPKKIYCGSEECDKERRRINSIAIEKRRSLRRKLERKHNRIINKAKFIRKIKKLLAEDDYTLISAYKYVNTHSSILTVKCDKGHVWKTTWHNYYHNNNRCLTCYLQNNYVSKPERMLREFIENNLPNIKVIYNDRSLIRPKELDFYFPDHNLAIEVCGLYWHSELKAGKSKWYHYDKMEYCLEKGVNLITIFEDELYNKFDVITSLLKYYFNTPAEIIDISDCSVSKLPREIAINFFNDNNIYSSEVFLETCGLVRDGDVLAACSIKYISNGELVISNMCLKNNIFIDSWYKMLFESILEYADYYMCDKIITYCDRRYSAFYGKYYELLGFKLSETSHPKMYYTNKGNRLELSANVLGLDDSSLEFDRIWDCGTNIYYYNV